MWQRTTPAGASGLQSRWFVGLDLGKTHDPTALAVLERRPVAQGKPAYHIHALQRFELDTPYTELITRVVALLNRPAKAGSNTAPLRGCTLGLDATGVGRPVVDMFVAARPPCRLVPVTITSGHRANWEAGEWFVPKADLVAAIRLVIQGKRITMDARLPLGELLKRELADFETRITPSGNETFGAYREGQHDDIVLATAIAIWLAERGGPTTTSKPFGVGGMPSPTGVLHHGNRGFQL